MKITQGQEVILRTFDRDGLSSIKRIQKVLPNYGRSLLSLIRRRWLFDSSADHGKGRFALTKEGGNILREILGREILALGGQVNEEKGKLT